MTTNEQGSGSKSFAEEPVSLNYTPYTLWVVPRTGSACIPILFLTKGIPVLKKQLVGEGLLTSAATVAHISVTRVAVSLPYYWAYYNK